MASFPAPAVTLLLLFTIQFVQIESSDSIHRSSLNEGGPFSLEDSSEEAAERWGAHSPPRAEVGCPAPCPACPQCHGCPSCPSAPPCPSQPACPSPPPCPRPVPPGYRKQAGHGYYRLHTTTQNWHSAKAACEREGAYLAVINSKSEATMAQNLIKSFGKDTYVHVGFHDLYIPRNYITIFGDSLAKAGYAQWEPGKPGKARCGSLSPAGTLADIDCGLERAFLCEWLE